MKNTLITSLAAISAIALGGCQIVMVQDAPGPRSSYYDGDFEHAGHKRRRLYNCARQSVRWVTRAVCENCSNNDEGSSPRRETGELYRQTQRDNLQTLQGCCRI